MKKMIALLLAAMLLLSLAACASTADPAPAADAAPAETTETTPAAEEAPAAETDAEAPITHSVRCEVSNSTSPRIFFTKTVTSDDTSCIVSFCR